MVSDFALMDPHDDLIELLIEGARYGDLEDVDSALVRHSVGVDTRDEAGRTGEWCNACMALSSTIDQ